MDHRRKRAAGVKAYSKTEKSKLYKDIAAVQAVTIKEGEGEDKSLEVEFFGDILKEEKYEIRISKDGERYYAY